MDHESEERLRIFKEELKQLAEECYIEEKTYYHVAEAHNQYYLNQKQKEQKVNDIAAVNVKANKEAPVETKKVKKSLSPQQVRERNITWSLNLGVIFLLIGGLVLATSTWDTLVNWMKTGLIAIVSLLFFALAIFTKRILKIKKTAFAFYVLGSLFLPIVILSVGYFGLLGTYFSFTGEGRYLFVSAGCLAVLPVYLFLSVKLASRLFVWFSFITFSVFAGFIIGSFYLPIDGFYLGIMVFNAALIIAYHYLKKQERFRLFTSEFVLYIQGNLILSTLLTLTVYNNELIYSFNLILTAILYFAMIFVTNHKEYHFVFSAMLVYGAYQLIEFTFINEIGAIAYALIGFLFLGLTKLVKDQSGLHKAFRYTSAVVSSLAFIYISVEGIVLRMNEPSMVLLIAYVIIGLNFSYLAIKVNRPLFIYLSPAFFMVALYEAVLLGQRIVGYEFLSLPLFIAGFFLYVGFGCLMRVDFFQSIKESSRDIGSIVMLLCTMESLGLTQWWQTGTMFLLLAVIAFFMTKYEKRAAITNTSLAPTIHALSIGLSVVMYFISTLVSEYMYDPVSIVAQGFVVAGIIVLLVSFIWKQFSRRAFSTHAFFVSHCFYLIGMLMAFSSTFSDILRSAVVLGGIGMAYLFYKKSGDSAASFIVSGLTLLFYLTVVYAIFTQMKIQADLYYSLQFVAGALLLLSIGLLIKRKDRILMNSYFWVGHIYLPLALIVTFFLFGEKAVWAFLVSIVIYAVSVRKAEKDWLINPFLYSFFTSAWIAIDLGMRLLELQAYEHYSFLLTSIGLAIAWYIGKGLWNRRIAFYTVPFSFIGILVFTLVTPYSLLTFFVTLLYIALLLVIMHKERWDVYNLIPLLIAFYALGLYGNYNVESVYFMLYAVAGFAVIYTVVGMLSYPFIYQNSISKEKLPIIDWYTIVCFMALFSLYGMTTEELSTKLLPGILIAANLVLQRKRIPSVAPKWFVFSACIYLLQPYYTVLMNTDVPALIEREMYVLPWIVLIIYLKKITDKKNKATIYAVQWSVLIIISLLLIQDGMASNTIYDALIVGTLSLASMLGGMLYRMKSFFFVGAGVLLLNVFLQTKPYWGNMPWWGYLLITGSILIGVASYNEWHKQKTADGKETILSIFNKKIIQKIKKWE
ncbi:hypothetical protein [Virgibacillus necropolis]|uniref:DUF2157 domain-containing protein n=1 Tax=Virgibacillus necropolis TaxID=163877 RepID=A0A221MEJ9_9BACI|nr:hypothetical protein [Virgibacillus necropolis]ASN06042.1 hypothetical protein CFK40_13955 [Virgibacillus necropolis]